MIGNMPAGSNKSDLVFYLNKLVVNYCSASHRSYYKKLVWRELNIANRNKWLPSATALQVINAVLPFACFRNSICAEKITVDGLIDWVASNASVSFKMSHVNYIEVSKNRIESVSRYSVCFIVDEMNALSEFDPPYTECHDLNYDAIFY